MPITTDHAGRTYASTEPYEVTRSRITEFAAALGDRPASDAVLPVATPTFAAVVVNHAWEGFFADPELDLDLARIVHAEQRFSYVRPLEPGDVVTAALRIDKVRVRGGAEFITTSVEVLDETGSCVLTADATFVHTREGAA